MARYSLNLPVQLKQDAEQWSSVQGTSLNQFILWAVAEKIGNLKQSLDDPGFPHITYHRGAAGVPTPVVRGTRIRVQTLVVWHRQGMSAKDIADEYGLRVDQVSNALAFYQEHRAEIDLSIAEEGRLEAEALA